MRASHRRPIIASVTAPVCKVPVTTRHPVSQPNGGLASAATFRVRYNSHALRTTGSSSSLMRPAFLKGLRERINPEIRALGSHGRPPSRFGKRVTQEDVADAIGVSRVWYALLERGAEIRTSTRLLDCVANVLMATPDERATLFRLAIPELRATQGCDDAPGVLETISLVRSATKRLWAATSESEALTVVSQELATWFDDAATVLYTRRLAPGMWEWPHIVDASAGRAAEAGREFVSLLTPEKLDELLLYPLLAQPGETATLASYADGPVNEAQRSGWSKHKIDDLIANFMSARVRSNKGLVAAFTVTHKAGRVYSDCDCAIIRALAELTS